MAKVYRIVNGGAELMKTVRCKDEGRELQDLLEKSPDLLAGDQINPEVPRRWLQIKREMSVPDPISATARWSIDFLYVDQDAKLTFVECKRHDDTRSRREVIAQVFDYVANSKNLWTSEELLKAARETQHCLGQPLEQALAEIGVTAESAEEFFARAIVNLKARDLRIILFLETAPAELKKLVEFLSEELSTVEIFLVEARRYQTDGIDVVVPTLWGFTERVRVERRLVAALATARRRWSEADFLGALPEGIPDPIARQAVERLHQGLKSAGFNLVGGTGRVPSFTVSLPEVSHLVLLTVTAEGIIGPSYGSFAADDQDPSLRVLRDRLASVLETVTHTTRPLNYPKCWPKFESADWVPRVDKLVERLTALARDAELEQGVAS